MKYDLIVIGGGSAGHAAARTASALGLNCALVEAPGELGGLCILRGCMPSKVIIETANRMREIRDAARFGIDAPPPQLNISKLRERLEYLTKDFRDHRQHEMKTAGYQLLRGEASFVTPHRISFTNPDGDESLLEAKAFIIATGSKPKIPDIEGLADTPFWTSDDAVKLPDTPKEIVILGGGSIGMEAAHQFEGFGSKVTVVVRKKHILDAYDEDVSTALEAESRERGIEFLTETDLARVSHNGGKFELHFKNERSPMQCDALLVATGRSPATQSLKLETIGLVMDHDRILIDDRCATSAPHIFAAGDCASPIPVVHLAVIQGEVAAKNAARRVLDGHSELSEEWHQETAMTGLFTDPQCVEIGTGEKAAAKKDIKIITGKVEYNDQGKGMIAGSRHGFVKIIADAETRKIIGAAGVGPQVLETSHVVQAAISQGLTLEEYVAIPHYHPTLVEAWVSAAQAAIDGAG